MARGEHGRQVRGAERAGPAAATVGGRPAVAGEYPGGPLACRVRLSWHPAAVLALPAEDGRLWRGGKRAGWNRGHDLATGAPLNRAARDGETRRRLAAGESVRAVVRALRCGLATVQRARLAVAMRGAPRPVSCSGP